MRPLNLAAAGLLLIAGTFAAHAQAFDFTPAAAPTAAFDFTTAPAPAPAAPAPAPAPPTYRPAFRSLWHVNGSLDPTYQRRHLLTDANHDGLDPRAIHNLTDREVLEVHASHHEGLLDVARFNAYFGARTPHPANPTASAVTITTATADCPNGLCPLPAAGLTAANCPTGNCPTTTHQAHAGPGRRPARAPAWRPLRNLAARWITRRRCR